MARPQKVSDEEILSTARELLLENPNIATTVIAKALGVSQAALFKRFGTKQELIFQALAPDATPPFLPVLLAGPNTEEPIADQLIRLLGMLRRFFVKMFPRLMALKACGFSPVEMMGKYDVAPPLAAIRALAGWLDKAVEQEQLGPHDTTGLAFILLGSVQSQTVFTHILGDQLPPLDSDVYVTQVIQTVLHGIAPTETV